MPPILVAIVVLTLGLVIGLVELLNQMNASLGLGIAALGLIAVAGGSLTGYFADRLPEFPRRGR